MRDLPVPTIQNLTTGSSIQGNHRQARYSLDITSDAAWSDVSTGDLLQLGSILALVLHKESVSGKYRQLLGITALPLDQTLTLPSGDTIKVWSAPAGLPADLQAQLLVAATAPGSQLYDTDGAITHLQQAADLLPAGDSLTTAIKDYIANHRQQTRIITQPGSGLSLGMILELQGVAGQLQVVSIDRQSLKGLEIATAKPITAEQPPANKSIISKLTGADRHAKI